MGAVPPAAPDQSSGATPPLIDVNAGPTSYAAPAQLTCRGKPKGASAPFLVSPYSGWSEINSFDDHHNPDYRLDGTIVLANGLTATASSGQSSDFFPAYWSTALRQYINYDGHNGYDFGISYQPVLAAGSGTVSYAGWNGSSESDGYGQMILIDHHNGYVTLYGHLSQLGVKTGDRVSAGQEIGISGSTGRSTGPHLHFSVFHNCQVTDPYGWTGHGRDPLLDFDGEHATYLWLPGHDPLVLNPPPNWPSYPLGLNIPTEVQGQGHAAHSVAAAGPRVIPPADRLLLLALPAPHAGELVSPSAALARTESAVTREAEGLAPYLEELRAEGLLENYQVIPAAGAVWVRGTATAARLEGLPGVASLTGVQPRDLVAAQSGLAHSILIQIGPQQAPSLWPVGFRSALHAWRPTAAVCNGHALLTGLALPGQRVIVSLMRRGSLAGAAITAADPETGGFVAMIHDTAGNPVRTSPGDVVDISSGGRTAEVSVLDLSVQARGHRVTGTARPGSTVVLALSIPSSTSIRRDVLTADASGRFAVAYHAALPAGTLAVASMVDDAGDQESATGFVPGLLVEEGSSTLLGWTVGDAPQLSVTRRGKLVLHRKLHPAADGTFQLDLQSNGHPLSVRAGDVISIGSRWHQRRSVIPALNMTFPAGSGRMRIVGPPRSRAHVRIQRPGTSDRSWNVLLNAKGVRFISWPNARAMAKNVTSSGNTISPPGEARHALPDETERATLAITLANGVSVERTLLIERASGRSTIASHRHKMQETARHRP